LLCGHREKGRAGATDGGESTSLLIVGVQDVYFSRVHTLQVYARGGQGETLAGTTKGDLLAVLVQRLRLHCMNCGHKAQH